MTARVDHPLTFVSWLLERYPAVRRLEFSRYKYTPKKVDDPRIVISVPAADVGTWFEKVCHELHHEEEIAFHSRVYLSDDDQCPLHIPMVDLKPPGIDDKLEKLKQALAELGIAGFVFFRSGRSFHLYCLHLVSWPEWVAVMGRLLLLNGPGQKEVIDSRWVGHRLLAGYGSLRWTNNSQLHPQRPDRGRAYKLQLPFGFVPAANLLREPPLPRVLRQKASPAFGRVATKAK